jgi:hypothetical protein
MKEIFLPSQGMNFDDALELVPQGESKSLTNCYAYGQTNGRGNIRVTTGNTLYNNPLSGGLNTVIHSLEDLDRGGVFHFVHNTLGNHTIWYNDRFLQGFQKVLEGGVLNFQLGIGVDADIKDGMLYWTQGWFDSYLLNGATGYQSFSPPRKVNIQKAIDYYAGTGGYSIIDWQTISLIKYPYSQSPIATYNTDTTRNINNLRGKLFQFAVQFVYDDGEESRWSPYSNVAIPEFSESMAGQLSVSPENDNRIEVELDSGHNTVAIVRLAVRESNDGFFRVIREFDKAIEAIADNTTITYDFYNDETSKPVEVGGQNFDLVPQVAKTQEMLHNNELALGNILEGYDLEDPKFACSYFIDELTSGIGGYDYNEILSEINDLGGGVQQVLIEPNADFPAGTSFIPAGSTFILSFYRTLSSAYYSSVFVTPVDYIGNVSLLYVAWAAYLNTLGHPVSYNVTGTPDLQIDGLGSALTNVKLVVNLANPRYKSWKTGSTVQFGIQYYDAALRDGTVWTNDACKVYIKPQSEEDTSGLSDVNNAYKVTCRMTITGIPPAWAAYYKIVYSGNLTMQSFQMRTVRKIAFDASLPGSSKLSLERWYRDTYAGATYHHEINAGDRVRFVRKTHPLSNENAEYIGQTFEFTVLKYDPVGGEAGGEAIWTEIIDWENQLGGFEGFLIEIFSLKAQTDVPDVWYEIGETYEVVNPYTVNRKHENQPASTVQIDFSDGDVYIRRREMGTGFTIDPWQRFSWYIEDFHFSDFYSSRMYDKGRYAITDDQSAARWLTTTIRASNKYLEETKINGLSKFDSSKRITLALDYGELEKIIEVGFTLKAICNRKNFSLYVNRAETYQGDGSSTVNFSQFTFGEVRPHEENSGTYFPRSVVQVDRAVYYWDVEQGAVIRDSANGLENISGGRYKMTGYFELIADQMRNTNDYNDVTCIMGHDPDKHQILFYYKIGAVEATLAFSTLIDRWECYYTFFPESMCTNGRFLISFKNGQLYSHDAGNTLYGSVITMSVQFGFSRQLLEFALLSIQSKSNYHMGLGNIQTSGQAAYNPMTSLIFTISWKRFQDKWTSKVYGDYLDPLSEPANPLVKIFNARPLLSNAFLIAFSKSEDYPTIQAIGIYYKIASE